MKFTKNLLKNIVSYGEEVCIFSHRISEILYNYSPKDFPKFSRRLYYFWRRAIKPIPLSVLINIMDREKIEDLEILAFSVRGGNKLFFPSEKEISFSYFLGLILGDGCLVQARRGVNKSTCRVQISFRDRKNANDIKDICYKIFGIVPSIYPNKGCFDMCIFSKPLILILNQKYEIPLGKKYSTIKVPEAILVGLKRNKVAFLKGVFDSDGNIYLHRGRVSVQLRQKSEKFLRQIKELFKEVGIYFNDPYYDRANDSWVLWSSKKELVDTFINKIVDFKIEAPVAQSG